MLLKVKFLNLMAGRPVAVLHEKTASRLDVHVDERILIKKRTNKIIAVVDLASGLLQEHEIAVSAEVIQALKLKEHEHVEIASTSRPKSIDYIIEKMHGKKLNYTKLVDIVLDIVNNALTESEIAYFVSAVYMKGMDLEETANLTRAMVETGRTLNLKKKMIVDKHCLPAEIPTIVRNDGAIKVESIGSIIDNIFHRCKPTEIHNDGEADFTNKNLNNLQVMVHNNNGEIEFAPVSAVYRLSSPEYLREITLIGNRKIQMTENHTTFVLKEGEIKNIMAMDIKKGDYILVPTKFKGRNINEISLKTDFYRNHKYKKIKEKLIITKEFMRLLGYYISEGFTNSQGIFFNFGSHEKELINDTQKCINSVFGINCTINKPHNTAIRVSVYSQMISEIFSKRIKAGSNALEKRIPSFIFDVSDEMKIEFLKALFKDDGYRRRGYEAIYVTSSKKLATDLQYFLSFLGISVSFHVIKEGEREFPLQNGTKYKSKVNELYHIYTQAREIFGGRQKDNAAFINLLPVKELGEIDTKSIGWEFRKRLRNQKYITKQKLKRIIKYIKSEDIKKIINGSTSVLKVKNAVNIPSNSKYVYDFRVDGHNRFVAGTAPMCIHNSIGGIAGNRTTPIIVSICAAAGLIMPKTSSRAITSAAGTADTIETITNVEFSIEEIKKIIRKTGACMVWGGALGLAPADDKIIQTERLLNLDPEAQLIASILAKKLSVGATHILLDIPCGRSAKVTKKQALKLIKRFKQVAKKLKLNVSYYLSNGEQPIGNGIGPILEMIDVLHVLRQDKERPLDLENKALHVSSLILEMTGKAKKGKGLQLAEKILKEGQAYRKFLQIIKAQDGKEQDFSKKLKIARLKKDMLAEKSGEIKEIDNKKISAIARAAGCPADKSAGIYLYNHVGKQVRRKEKLLTIYAENKDKLRDAVAAFHYLKPIFIE
ncbi:thymidine phosphorylase [Candidatus Pacearchaeota archaeon]|nr:thymidine phosphorylase [Candidatus Pacearchaeota archaeon]